MPRLKDSYIPCFHFCNCDLAAVFQTDILPLTYLEEVHIADCSVPDISGVLSRCPFQRIVRFSACTFEDDAYRKIHDVGASLGRQFIFYLEDIDGTL